MLKRIDLRGKSLDLAAFLPSSAKTQNLPIDQVRAIIDQVRTGGDEALRDLTQKYDGTNLEELEVNQEQITDAYNSVSSGFREAIASSAEAIIKYQETQLSGHKALEDRGLSVETFKKPVQSAGCYVPGGLAAYPSTLLMTALVARVAEELKQLLHWLMEPKQSIQSM